VWLLDRGSIYKSTAAWLPDSSMQQRLIARAAEIGKCWPELPVARKRAVLAALIKRIEVKVDQIDIHLRPLRLGVLLDLPATPSQGVNDDEIELLEQLAARKEREMNHAAHSDALSLAGKPSG